MHTLHCPFADFDGFSHQQDLTVALDLTCLLHHRKAVMHLVAQLLHYLHTNRGHSVDGNAPAATAVLTDNGIHLNRPNLGSFSRVLAGIHVAKCSRLGDPLDPWQPVREQ